MADVEDGRAESRQAAAPLRSGRRTGSIATIVAAAVAVAAIVVCVILFVQVGGLKKQLEAASVEVPAGYSADTGEAGAHGEHAGAADEYGWQDSPLEVTYELGEFRFNTADGRHGLMDIALVLESGWTAEDRQGYETLLQFHDAEVAKYQEWLRGQSEGQMSMRQAPGLYPALAALRSESRLLRGGVLLAMHGAPKAEPPPEDPGPPPALPEGPVP